MIGRVMLMLAALSLCFLSGCGETERKRRTTGYKGEARSNAFLAAQRLLEARGYSVDRREGLGGLDYGVSTVFVPPSSLNTVGRAKRVMRWVSQGGHLVVMVTGGERRGNDFRMEKNDWSMFDEDPSGLSHVFDVLGVRVNRWQTEAENSLMDGLDEDDWEKMPEKDRVLLGSEVSKFTLLGEELIIHHWSDRALVYDLDDSVYFDIGSNDVTDENKHRFLSLAHGAGRVSFLGDARPLRNRYIGQADHAQLLVDLVDLSEGGQVVFASGAGEGFFSMLWRYFWMAVVALAVAVVFWLWKSLPRFGPVQDLPPSLMREFSGQVRGVGRFLWHHKRHDVLLGSLRENVARRVGLSAGAQGEGVFEQIAERSGLTVEQVIEAMTRGNVREPGVMVRVTRNLQKILISTN